ncbi:MAG: hypothetical protein A2Y07_05890 [Planctomycetes bacterium GWF2_50_10]|nr:MAG: hypothetical protein A2Y07_05890 [Planctomycetes bacterium GWF2_50_10]
MESVLSKGEFKELVDQMSLSPKESEIIHDILSGYTDKQIAIHLNMALPTIRTHLKRTFTKLGVNGKHELILHIFSQFRKGCSNKQCPRIGCRQ